MQNLIRSSETGEVVHEFSHPLNDDSLLYISPLSARTGMERVAVKLGRLTKGHESFIYHTQHSDEEWLYIISGRGIAEIDGEEYEVGPGDFMGFPTPSVAHTLRNPFDEDLTYLMGGENHDVEVADFPKLGKQAVFTPTDAKIYDVEDGQPFA